MSKSRHTLRTGLATAIMFGALANVASATSTLTFTTDGHAVGPGERLVLAGEDAYETTKTAVDCAPLEFEGHLTANERKADTAVFDTVRQATSCAELTEEGWRTADAGDFAAGLSLPMTLTMKSDLVTLKAPGKFAVDAYGPCEFRGQPYGVFDIGDYREPEDNTLALGGAVALKKPGAGCTLRKGSQLEFDFPLGARLYVLNAADELESVFLQEKG